MRFKASTAIALLALACAAAPAQDTKQNDQKVIEDFVGTRGISFDEPGAKPAPAKPKPAPRPSRPSGGAKNSTSASKKPNTGGAKNSTTASGKTSPGKQTGAGQEAGVSTQGVETAGTGAGPEAGGASLIKASLATRPIGLGYTLFLKDKVGGLAVADPSRQFKSGDAVAIALETNTDGYLYVFNAENGQNPVMLFPHVMLDGGANKVNAHERVTYPADVNYSFVFDERPATEHLYIIVSRQPLAGVPTGEALVNSCRASREDCYWQPSAEQWEKLKGGVPGSRVKESKSVLLAQAQTSIQPASLTRGIKIKKNEPAPTVVRVNDSPETNVLVTTIELAHK